MRDDALDQLSRMTRALLEEPHLERGLQHIAQAALDVLGGDHASLRLCQPDGRLTASARAGIGTDRPPPRFRRGEGVLGWVAETREAMRVDDSAREPRFQDRSERGFAVSSLLSVPVIHGERTLGVLSVSSARPRAFGAADEAVAMLLASSAALTLRSAELERLALTDSHTLAYNRRYLLPRLNDEIERARRQGDSLALLLIDLDHFKRVNDQHGHGVGDAVLRACADAVRECVRAADVLVRRGGEEFVLIMPSTDLYQATAVAQRIRTRLRERRLKPRATLELRQTASIGVASWDGCESAEALEERADRAMYMAKHGGRDRVETACISLPPRANGVRASG